MTPDREQVAEALGVCKRILPPNDELRAAARELLGQGDALVTDEEVLEAMNAIDYAATDFYNIQPEQVRAALEGFVKNTAALSDRSDTPDLG